MWKFGRRGIHYWQKVSSANVHTALLETGQKRVIDASLTLIRERAKLKVYYKFNLKELFIIRIRDLLFVFLRFY